MGRFRRRRPRATARPGSREQAATGADFSPLLVTAPGARWTAGPHARQAGTSAPSAYCQWARSGALWATAAITPSAPSLGADDLAGGAGAFNRASAASPGASEIHAHGGAAVLPGQGMRVAGVRCGDFARNARWRTGRTARVRRPSAAARSKSPQRCARSVRASTTQRRESSNENICARTSVAGHANARSQNSRNGNVAAAWRVCTGLHRRRWPASR